MRDRKIADDIEALAEVSVPELVGSRESSESSLVEERALGEGSVGFGDEIAPP